MSFIVSGQLPLWNPLALCECLALPGFSEARPPASVIWLIRSCGSKYLPWSTTYLCCTQSFSLWCPLCWQSVIPLSLDCLVRVTHHLTTGFTHRDYSVVDETKSFDKS
jgi:hypothetical protein